ncbi:MAG TPA: hypothetical protein VEX18_19675, partial [Polyangiaceae bacterium]|nr:hypothetical protein [Polyangiaceae bacterium]
MGSKAKGCVVRVWSRRASIIGSVVLGSVGWAASASAAPRADYDLDDDGLIEINDLGDLNDIRNNAFGSSLYGSSSGCPATGCFGFSLTADLNFDTSGNGSVGPEDDYFTENVGWVPLPYLTAFFDGAGHTIRNLTIIGVVNNDDPVGLFSRISAGVVHDLRLQNASFVMFNPRTGVLAGEALDSSVERVSVVGGSVFINNLAEIGGVIGNCEWSELKESYTSLDVRASNSVGGLVGRGSNCHVSRSFVLGRTTSDRYSPNIGGVIGEMIDGSITDSFVSGSVGEGPFFGGLAGQSTGTPTITNSYVSGAVVGTGAAGGAMLGFGPATFVSSFYATDTTGFTKTKTAGGGATGVTLANLKCSDAPSDPDCLPGLFAGWQTSLNSDGQPAWDFGSNQQVPALRIQGIVYRDSDGDGLLDAEDEFPSAWAASLDSDNDGAVDFWREGCEEQCIATSGLVLDQFPTNVAAAVDLDLDGRPDSWNPACNSTCQAASGLTLDTRPGDFDNDGISDASDQDDDGNGVPDVDLDSDNLIDIDTHEELALIHNDPTGISLRRTDTLPEFGSVADASGCRPRIVGPITALGSGEFVIRSRVLARHCEGYELLSDLDLDTNGDDVINETDAYWNEGRGWDSLGHFGDDPRVAFQATFEGNGHTISNVFVAQDPTNEGGLFGGVRGGNIRNLGVVGDLASVTSDAWLGGLVAQVTSSIISNCYSTAPVFSEGGFYAGGLVGLAANVTITGSFATGDLLATEGFCGPGSCDASGGLVGALRYDSIVTASFASGSVFSTNGSAGGLAGEADTGSMVFGSFSTTLVQAASDPPGQVGGFLGRAEEDVAIASYWATDTSTQNFSAGNAEGATLSQLQCPVG